ncbi:hypothetical protein D7Z26_13225 [Cohnella endophytica]|uniref:Uncharacterized protein n=1 Tax=Cohnella endophytica TaxID=2419778 RepID=A0A494XZ24_9BACL|nr:FecR domain-containing protein [Cohnella endophytica]RKP54319.1 hypothetical protein D7Z26_13225 [Cohnella endophytica]
MRKVLISVILLLIVLLPLLGVYGSVASAATSRVAIVKELKGTVKVKKAGGSREFTVFSKMSLNEGDILSTSSGSSAVLQFANGTSEDDRMSVSANTVLTFSKLSSKKGTTTKVSMLSGTAWVDVKSITNKDDEFALETPTAIMGVRGTHLLVSVDPESGVTRLTVAAGVVNTQAKNSATPDSFDVFPTQNALITNDETDGSNITIAAVDLEMLIKQASGDIVRAILQASAEIIQENTAKMDRYLDELAQKQNDQDRVKTNVENILGAITSQAVQSGLLTQDQINRIIAGIQTQSGVTIDLSPKTLTFTAEEKRKQEEQRKSEEAALQRMKELKLKEAELLSKQLADKLEKERKNKEEENKNKLQEKLKKAQENYEKGLSEAERQKYENEKSQREAEIAKGSSSNTANNDSNPSANPSENPNTEPSENPNADSRLLLSLEVYPSPNPRYVTTIVESQQAYVLNNEPNTTTMMILTPQVREGSTILSVTVDALSVPRSSNAFYFDLKPGKSIISITVAEIGNSSNQQTYTFDVYRALSSNTALNGVTVNGTVGDLPYTANPDQINEDYQYVFYVPAGMKTSYIQFWPTASGAKVTLNGFELPNGQLETGILAYGLNTYVVQVKAPDQTAKTYKVDIYRALGSFLNGVSVSDGYKTVKKSVDYYTNVKGSTTSITVTLDMEAELFGNLVSTSFSQATISKGSDRTLQINGLQYGMNLFQVQITDLGVNQFYSLFVWRGIDIDISGKVTSGDVTYGMEWSSFVQDPDALSLWGTMISRGAGFENYILFSNNDNNFSYYLNDVKAVFHPGIDDEHTVSVKVDPSVGENAYTLRVETYPGNAVNYQLHLYVTIPLP